MFTRNEERTTGYRPVNPVSGKKTNQYLRSHSTKPVSYTHLSYRSYGQLEAEYRIGRNMLLEGDLLSVYSRVFADTGENGVMMPVKNPMSGTGLRWKPLRDQIFFLAVEQQLDVYKRQA